MGLTPFAIGVLFALQALVGIVTRPVAGRWSDRLGREPMIVSGLIICGVSVACVPIASGPLSLLLPVIASAVGVAMATTAASALITDRSRQINYGAAHGVFGTVYDVGDAMGPIARGRARLNDRLYRDVRGRGDGGPRRGREPASPSVDGYSGRRHFLTNSSISASTRRLISALAISKSALTDGTARQSVGTVDANTGSGMPISKVMTR